MALETITVVLLILAALAGIAFAVLWLPRALYRSLIRLYAEFRARPTAVDEDSDPVWPARNELVRGSEPIEPE